MNCLLDHTVAAADLYKLVFLLLFYLDAENVFDRVSGQINTYPSSHSQFSVFYIQRRIRILARSLSSIRDRLFVLFLYLYY